MLVRIIRRVKIEGANHIAVRAVVRILHHHLFQSAGSAAELRNTNQIFLFFTKYLIQSITA